MSEHTSNLNFIDDECNVVACSSVREVMMKYCRGVDKFLIMKKNHEIRQLEAEIEMTRFQANVIALHKKYRIIDPDVDDEELFQFLQGRQTQTLGQLRPDEVHLIVPPYTTFLAEK